MVRVAASLSAIAALVVLATGCVGTVNEKNWGAKSARISCKLAKRCSTSQFYYHYDDLSECIDDATAGASCAGEPTPARWTVRGSPPSTTPSRGGTCR